jgi:hypothetical protein
MVGSRHSSLRLPSTTVTATVARPWSWAAVTSPAGHPSSQASTSAVTSSGTDQAGWSGAVDGRKTPRSRSATLPERGPISGGAGSFVGSYGPAGAGPYASADAGSLARRMVSSTRSASDHGGAAGRPRVSRERMRSPFGGRPALGGRAAAGRRRAGRRARGPARAGGSPQREGGAGRRARGHAQDPFSLGVRRGSRPRVAFRCGMASGRVPSPAPCVKTKGRTGHLYRIATIPCCCGCRINLVDWGDSAMVSPPLVPASP